jgi:hypothetical protein
VVLNSASAGPVPDRCVLPKLDIARDINVLSISAPLTAPPPRTLRKEGLSVPYADVLNTCVVCHWTCCDRRDIEFGGGQFHVTIGPGMNQLSWTRPVLVEKSLKRAASRPITSRSASELASRSVRFEVFD